jgi:hypothetical protein
MVDPSLPEHCDVNCAVVVQDHSTGQHAGDEHRFNRTHGLVDQHVP